MTAFDETPEPTEPPEPYLFEQLPQFEPPSAFDEITSRIPKPPIWLAAFEETEALLLADCPEGVELLDVGRAAWACLPDEAAREEAFDALFYGWWENYQNLKARNAFRGGAA